VSLAFANPALLWGLLAAAIPLVIHLFFRRRPRPTPFPAIDFILRARRETERRLRLRKLLLFAARTLLLAAVALAVTRPRLEEPGVAAAAVQQGPRATAVVLDASASMRYRLDGRTLFERARGDALGALAALSPEEPATALVCGDGPPAAEPPGFDRAAVRRALESAEPSHGHADLTACVSAALAALAASEAQASLPKRLVVATDLTASAWRLDVPAPTVEGPSGAVRPEVNVLDAARGAALPNTAIVSMEAEPDPAAGPRGHRVTVGLANPGGEARRDLPLQLAVGAGAAAAPGPGAAAPPEGGRVAIRAFADLPAGAGARKQLSLSLPQGGPVVLTASLPPDALPEDDARVLPLVVAREVRALVVDGAPSPVRYRDEAYFVESALASPASPVRPRLVDAEAFAAEDLSQVDVVFLLNVRSVAAKGPELARFVEGGGGLFVAVGDQVDPEAYDRELGALLPLPLHVEKTAAGAERSGPPGASGRGAAARLVEVQWDHPALAVFTGDAREGLLGARVFRYLLAKPPRGGPDRGARILASFDDGSPALVEGRHGKGRVLLFTSTVDRDWTDWPIRTSFLPAMQRFAGFLAGSLEERREPPLPVGAPRTIRPDDGETVAALLGPDARERSPSALEAEGAREGEKGGIVYAPRVPGLWQVKVRSASGEERLEPRLAFAATPDPRESDTRRLRDGELTAWFGGEAHARVEGDAGAAAGAGRQIPLWTLLLVLGLAAFFLEGLLVS
jgi:hypothetical protein